MLKTTVATQLKSTLLHLLDASVYNKALQNWKISVKALSKQLWELTKLTKQLIAIIITTTLINENND